MGSNRITLIQGDCLVAMEKLFSDGVRVDLVCMDPPYNIRKESWDSWKQDDHYLEFMQQVFQVCDNILKPTGSLYWFHNQIPTITRLLYWLDDQTAFHLRSFITWNKGEVRSPVWKKPDPKKSNLRCWFPVAEYIMFHTFHDGGTGWKDIKNRVESWPNLRDYFRRLLESLRINGEKITYTKLSKYLGHYKAEHCFYWDTTQWALPTKETYEEILSIPRVGEFKVEEYEKLKEEYEKLKEEYESLRYKFNLGYSMNNVWDIPYMIHQGEKIIHPTQKPIKLIKKIVKASSDHGGLVIDPFMGSGTTGEVCKQLGRGFIGIETDKNYYQISKKRIDQTVYEPELFQGTQESMVPKQPGLFEVVE